MQLRYLLPLLFLPFFGHAQIRAGIYRRGSEASVELFPFKQTKQFSTMIFVYQKMGAMCAFEGLLRPEGNGNLCSYQEKDCRLCVEGDEDVVRVRIVRGCEDDCGSTAISFNVENLRYTGK